MIRWLRWCVPVAGLFVGCGTPAPAPSGSTTGASTGAAATVSATASATATATVTAAASGSAAPPRAAVKIEADAGAAERVAALVKEPPRPASGKGAGFVGPVDVKLDSEWITRLATAVIVEVTPNRGGSSVSMKVRFADGKKAALKPEQTGRPTDPRSEIAGYHLDRLLGFGRTAAVVGRSFRVAELRAALVAAGADSAFLERVDRLLVVKEGRVDAAMIAWHTAPLVEEEVAPAWAAALEKAEAVAPDAKERLAEWSDLVVFDFLVDNPDRLSGGNILRLDKGGPLVFLDQGAAFGRGRLREKKTEKERLDKVCRFRRDTLAALSAVSSGGAKGLGAELAASVGKDPIAPVLDEAQLKGVDERAATVAAHVKGCRGKLGAAASL